MKLLNRFLIAVVVFTVAFTLYSCDTDTRYRTRYLPTAPDTVIVKEPNDCAKCHKHPHRCPKGEMWSTGDPDVGQ